MDTNLIGVPLRKMQAPKKCHESRKYLVIRKILLTIDLVAYAILYLP